MSKESGGDEGEAAMEMRDAVEREGGKLREIDGDGINGGGAPTTTVVLMLKVVVRGNILPLLPSLCISIVVLVLKEKRTSTSQVNGFAMMR